MPLRIREASIRDLPALQILYQQLDADGTTLAELEQGFHSMQAYPGCQVFVAELKESVVGTFVLYFLPNMTRNARPAAILENIVVDAQYRGQGIGRKMMEYAHELALAQGCYKLSLTSNGKRIEAHEFYRHCGMLQHGLSFRYVLEK